MFGRTTRYEAKQAGTERHGTFAEALEIKTNKHKA